MEINLMYSDGLAGRDYYMMVNGVRIEVVDVNPHKRVLEIFKALNIDYEGEVSFKHDGWM